MNRIVFTGNAIRLARALRLRQNDSLRVINARDSRMEWIREEKLLTCSRLQAVAARQGRQERHILHKILR